jgi:hypothetical protein
MGIMDRLRKKETNVQAQSSVKMLSELEQICGDDKETYMALYHTMFLDPRKIHYTIKDAVDNAKKYEKERNMGRARIWYDIAGGIALYEGNPKKVAELFGEAEKLSGLEYPIVNRSEKAVAAAQEYYRKTLKEKVEET